MPFVTWVCVSLRRSYGARGKLGKSGMCPNPGGRVARSLARSLALAVLWAEVGGDGRHLPPILFNCYWGCQRGQIGVLCARATLACVLRKPRDGPGIARWQGGGVLLLPRSLRVYLHKNP